MVFFKKTTMKIWYANGVHIQYGSMHILCDPSATKNSEARRPSYDVYAKQVNEYEPLYERVKIILVSHAHTDHCDKLIHFANKQCTVIAHPMSIAIRPRQFANLINLQTIREGESIKIDDVRITAYPSGHCGGSVMFKLDLPDGVVLFTGDINTQASMTTDPAVPRACDVLLTEATFGKPDFAFPPRFEVYNDLARFLKDRFNLAGDPTKTHHRAVLVYGQGLGKMQDVTKLLTGYDKMNLRVLVDDYAYTMNQHYEQYYQDPVSNNPALGKYIHADTTWTVSHRTNTVYLGSMQSATVEGIRAVIQRYGLEDQPPIAILSGWAQGEEDRADLEAIKKEFCDVMFFAISSHSGFLELQDFVAQCDADCVGTFHGFSKDYALTLQKDGRRAHDLHTDVIEYVKY